MKTYGLIRPFWVCLFPRLICVLFSPFSPYTWLPLTVSYSLRLSSLLLRILDVLFYPLPMMSCLQQSISLQPPAGLTCHSACHWLSSLQPDTQTMPPFPSREARQKPIPQEASDRPEQCKQLTPFSFHCTGGIRNWTGTSYSCSVKEGAGHGWIITPPNFLLYWVWLFLG